METNGKEFNYDKIAEEAENYYQKHKYSPSATKFHKERVHDCVVFLNDVKNLALDRGFERGEFALIMTMGIELTRMDSESKEDFEKWFTHTRSLTREYIENVFARSAQK